MLGKPKYKYNDVVTFKLADGIERTGCIYIIDEYGTFGQHEDVSYDIMVESENCLYKHVMEQYVSAKIETLV